MDRNREDHFAEDPRYRQCNREALISVAVFLISFVIIGVVSLLLGYGKPADEIGLIAGFPDWYFYGVVVGGIVTALLPIAAVMLFFREMSIEAVDEERGEER
jgi:uncharacterized membrane protein YhdT